MTQNKLAWLVGMACFTALLALAQSAGSSVWDGVYSEQQANRGDSLYAAKCASCHGTSLTGGESAPPLAGGEFLSNWNGLTLGDLFERTRTTMPANRPGALTREECADVLAYLLKMNQFPVGKTDLARQTEFLKLIRLDAQKP